MNNSHTNRLRSHMQEMEHQAEECVANHPFGSSAVLFGVGFGLGLMVVLALDSMRDDRQQWVSKTEGIAHRIGAQVLDALRGAVPESLERQLRNFR